MIFNVFHVKWWYKVVDQKKTSTNSFFPVDLGTRPVRHARQESCTGFFGVGERATGNLVLLNNRGNTSCMMRVHK